ncbi:MAG: VanZ family protein [Acidihalobacter sp.]|jgi:VanZ family protein
MRSPAHSNRTSVVLVWLSLLYPLLIAYASLFPLDWHPPATWSNPLLHPWPRSDSRSDILVNVLAYVPLGLLLALVWHRFGRSVSAALALGAGFGLSFGMEFLQEALPGRVSSVADIAHNTLGTLFGVVFAQILSRDTLSGDWLRARRARLAVPGALANMSLVAVALWAAAELFPFVPSPDMATIKHGLRPLLDTLLHPATFAWWQVLGDVFELLGIGMLARCVLREPSLLLTGMLILAVAALKVIVVHQVLSLEFLAAALVAPALLALFGWQTPHRRAAVALVSIAASLVIDELRSGTSTRLHAFNWIPFSAQIGTLSGFNGLFVTVWIALALAAATRILVQDSPKRERWASLPGAALLFCSWFALEWHQQLLPGRIPDVTDPLVALGVWWLAWLVPARGGFQARVKR